MSVRSAVKHMAVVSAGAVAVMTLTAAAQTREAPPAGAAAAEQPAERMYVCIIKQRRTGYASEIYQTFYAGPVPGEATPQGEMVVRDRFSQQLARLNITWYFADAPECTDQVRMDYVLTGDPQRFVRLDLPERWWANAPTTIVRQLPTIGSPAIVVAPSATPNQVARREDEQRRMARLAQQDLTTRRDEQARQQQRQAELRVMAAQSAERDARFRARDAFCRANPRACPATGSRVTGQ